MSTKYNIRDEIWDIFHPAAAVDREWGQIDVRTLQPIPDISPYVEIIPDNAEMQLEGKKFLVPNVNTARDAILKFKSITGYIANEIYTLSVQICMRLYRKSQDSEVQVGEIAGVSIADEDGQQRFYLSCELRNLKEKIDHILAENPSVKQETSHKSKAAAGKTSSQGMSPQNGKDTPTDMIAENTVRKNFAEVVETEEETQSVCGTKKKYHEGKHNDTLQEPVDPLDKFLEDDER